MAGTEVKRSGTNAAARFSDTVFAAPRTVKASRRQERMRDAFDAADAGDLEPALDAGLFPLPEPEVVAAP